MLEPTDTTRDTTDDSAPTSAEAVEQAGTPAKKPVKKAAKKAAKKAPARTRKAAAKAAPSPEDRADGEPVTGVAEPPAADVESAAADAPAPRKRAAKKATRKAAATADDTAPVAVPETTDAASAGSEGGAQSDEPPAPAKRARKRATKKAAAATDDAATAGAADRTDAAESGAAGAAPTLAAPAVLFQPPAETAPQRLRRRAATPPVATETDAIETPDGVARTDADALPAGADLTRAEDAEDAVAEPDDVREAAVEEATGARRRRRRGRRGRGGGQQNGAEAEASADAADEAEGEAESDEEAEGTAGTSAASTRRRRRRRRSGGGEAGETTDDPPNTVTHVRPARELDDDGVKAVKGSTRLEAKRQRRRDGRETSRRRPPILTEAEFLARREAVERVMAVRQTGDRTQIAVLEDDILVEHYVTRASSTSYVGNVYLGRVQNVLPSMEAAFIDIGKGRNGVLYAGEVNWDAAGLEGKSRAIEQALKPGDVVLVQVTKDPIGHKGARLTSQVSLPGRFLVYVPGGGMTGISRKLPDTERHRLKTILKKIVPEDAGVIVRTAAEGASEEDLTRDVERLQSQWQTISTKAEKTSAAPSLVHGEPDLAIRVVRDVFNEDFRRLIVEGEQAWQTVSDYVAGVAPDLADRVSRHTGDSDLFADLRVDEQLMKALDRKVWLPSGGSLVIDRTEAMTVIDVNTGKFVGAGGNLEQTVTRNNLEAAEEIVRQLRLRDVGGIVVIDFIDMVLESNRELVLRRLTECLGRDRTKHQVAEVTSLGLVQMTRKRVGEGLLEAFSEPCEVCRGRGVIIHAEPVDRQPAVNGDGAEEERPKSKRRKPAKKSGPNEAELAAAEEQRRAAQAAMTAIHRAAHAEDHDGLEAAELAAVAEDVVAAVLDADLAIDATDLAIDATDLATGLSTETADVDAEAAEPAAETAEPAAEAAEPVAETAEPTAEAPPASARPRRRRAASRPAGPPVAVGSE